MPPGPGLQLSPLRWQPGELVLGRSIPVAAVRWRSGLWEPISCLSWDHAATSQPLGHDMETHKESRV